MKGHNDQKREVMACDTCFMVYFPIPSHWWWSSDRLGYGQVRSGQDHVKQDQIWRWHLGWRWRRLVLRFIVIYIIKISRNLISYKEKIQLKITRWIIFRYWTFFRFYKYRDKMYETFERHKSLQNIAWKIAYLVYSAEKRRFVSDTLYTIRGLFH